MDPLSWWSGVAWTSSLSEGRSAVSWVRILRVDCPSPLVLWDSHPLVVGTPSRGSLLLWLGCVALGLQYSRGGK